MHVCVCAHAYDCINHAIESGSVFVYHSLWSLIPLLNFVWNCSQNIYNIVFNILMWPYLYKQTDKKHFINHIIKCARARTHRNYCTNMKLFEYRANFEFVSSLFRNTISFHVINYQQLKLKIFKWNVIIFNLNHGVQRCD